MPSSQHKPSIYAHDERRDLSIPGSREATLDFSVQHFLSLAKQSITARGRFCVALSGGSTPKAIFERLSDPELAKAVDWSKVYVFWSDERAVPPEHPDSNYRMAMDSGWSSLPVPECQIFRMKAEEDIESSAKNYSSQITQHVPENSFDLIMLGMGEDGHTASLFPSTHGLHSPHQLVVANYVPQQKCWRMTFTFDCINLARNIVVYVLGASKAETVRQVLDGPFDPDLLPSQNVGTPARKALWILDLDAAGAI